MENQGTNEILPATIVHKISNIHIPLNDIQDKIIWKYTVDGNFSVKKATWTSNEKKFPSLELNY